jgi:anti-sigma-K factor RskA
VNVSEYISSGVLEAYATGSLEPSERLEVEANLLRYPELRSELALVEESLEQLMIRAAKQPRQEIKARIMSSVAGTTKETPVIALPGSASALWKYATAASVALAITSASLAYVYWSNWKRAETSLTELIAQNQQIAQDYNAVNQRLDKIEGDLAIYDNPSFRKVVMKGTKVAPDAMASIYWNESSNEVYLSIQNLKTLSQEKQYQLWAIVDGQPHDMGVFDGDAKGLVRMKPGEGIAAFAVTIEPRGGKASPTMETMQVLGNT